MEMTELVQYRKQLLERLATVVDDLCTALAAIPPQSLHVASQPDGESPHRRLARLRSAETRVFSPRLKQISEEENPVLEIFDVAAWMEQHYDPQEPADAILEEYARLRGMELGWLQELPTQGWNRLSRHPWFGLRTLQWWVERCLAYSESQLSSFEGAHRG